MVIYVPTGLILKFNQVFLHSRYLTDTLKTLSQNYIAHNLLHPRLESTWILATKPSTSCSLHRYYTPDMEKSKWGQSVKTTHFHTRQVQSEWTWIRWRKVTDTIKVNCIWYQQLCFLLFLLFVVGWLHVSATSCLCIPGMDLLRQMYVLSQWDRSCRSNLLSNPFTVYWHRVNQHQCWP